MSEGNGGNWALLNKDDLEHFRRGFANPGMKVAVGTTAAVACGVALLGPVGLLVGAASVGIGAGIMQIPEEQRARLQDRAGSACRSASEALSSNCGAVYEGSGLAEKLPDQVAAVCSGDGCGGDDGSTGERSIFHGSSRLGRKDSADAPLHQRGSSVGSVSGMYAGDGMLHIGDSDGHPEDRMRRKVACLRKGRIIPANQVHALDPSLQPKAWFDILANLVTSQEDKNEAMEEILIFAKDKDTALMLMEEGILDALMYILSCFFRKYAAELAKGTHPANYRTDGDFISAQLAANCCVALAKAHCAVVHTEGDLLLMSSYARGTVPVERQLAQMLHEVPHHVNMTAGTVLYPRGVHDGCDFGNNPFSLTELSLQHAEEVARSVNALVHGQIDISVLPTV